MAATTSPARWKDSPGTDPGSDIAGRFQLGRRRHREDLVDAAAVHVEHLEAPAVPADAVAGLGQPAEAVEQEPRQRVMRSEEHTSEPQSLMRNSYAVFCLKKKKQ